MKVTGHVTYRTVTFYSFNMFRCIDTKTYSSAITITSVHRHSSATRHVYSEKNKDIYYLNSADMEMQLEPYKAEAALALVFK